MGSSLSGLRSDLSRFTFVTEVPCIDIFKLKNLKAFQPGTIQTGRYTDWQLPNSKPHRNVAFRADLTDPDKSIITITFNPPDSQREFQETIPLTTSKARYGGWIYWFLCPGCGIRKRKLFVHKNRIRCRECHDLRFLRAVLSHREGIIALADTKLIEKIWGPVSEMKAKRMATVRHEVFRMKHLLVKNEAIRQFILNGPEGSLSSTILNELLRFDELDSFRLDEIKRLRERMGW